MKKATGKTGVGAITTAVGVVIASAFVAGSAVAAPQSSRGGYGRYGHGGPEIVRCESKNGDSRRCDISSNGEVRLVRQLSSTPCVDGRNWGRDRGAIWVTDGCRGEFSVRGRAYGNPGYGGGYGSGGDTFRCESNDNRYRQCASSGGGGARLVRQLSDTQCIEGRTWGSNRTGVWVDRGCRGEFVLSGGGWGNLGSWNDRYNRSGYAGGDGRTVRCESNDDRTRRCAADIRRDVRLVRQLSDTRCVQGQNWGWDRRGVWVTRGCRAEFELR